MTSLSNFCFVQFIFIFCVIYCLGASQVAEEYPGSAHHGNLTANDIVSSAVVVSSDPGTVYLDQGGVALAELLPGTVSIPVSGTGEGNADHN